MSRYNARSSHPTCSSKERVKLVLQSAARELMPKGIHVAHFVIDGSVRSAGQSDPSDATLDSDAIAQAYIDVLCQHRSAWSSEIEIRQWVELH